MPPITLLIKPASGMCNMKCDYCFYCDEMSKREKACLGLMTEQTLKNVIRKTILKAENYITIAFQGGEPTLCGIPFFERVIDYVKQYNKHNIRVDYVLQTNGLGITKEWCEFFATYNFLIGVSLDGTKDIHDKYRHSADGGPTWDRIVSNIKMFDKYDVQYNVLTVVHKEMAANIIPIYEHFKRNGWEFMQFITCLDPLGEKRGEREYSLSPKDYGKFLVDLFSVWYEDYMAERNIYIRQFENYIGILLGYMPESCEQRGRCGIQYVIESDGSTYPCDFYVLDEWKLGNFNSNSLEEIDLKRKETGFLERSNNHPEECVKCKWLKLCRGGCYRSRMTEEENDSGKNYFCEGYKMFFEQCYDKLQLICEKEKKRIIKGF